MQRSWETSLAGRETGEYRGTGQRPQTGVTDFEQHRRQLAEPNQKDRDSDEEYENYVFEKDITRTAEKESRESKIRTYYEK